MHIHVQRRIRVALAVLLSGMCIMVSQVGIADEYQLGDHDEEIAMIQTMLINLGGVDRIQ